MKTLRLHIFDNGVQLNAPRKANKQLSHKDTLTSSVFIPHLYSKRKQKKTPKRKRCYERWWFTHQWKWGVQAGSHERYGFKMIIESRLGSIKYEPWSFGNQKAHIKAKFFQNFSPCRIQCGQERFFLSKKNNNIRLEKNSHIFFTLLDPVLASSQCNIYVHCHRVKSDSTVSLGMGFQAGEKNYWLKVEEMKFANPTKIFAFEMGSD